MEACKKKKKPLIILTGPTAVGKTALSIGLAKAVGERSFLRIRCRYTKGWMLVRQRLRRRKWTA